MNLQFKTKFIVQFPVKKGLYKRVKNSFNFFSEALKIEKRASSFGQHKETTVHNDQHYKKLG